MRVAVVLSELAAPPRSGLQEQSLLLLGGLLDAGVEVELFAFRRAGTTAIDAKLLPVQPSAPLMNIRGGWTVTGLLARLFGRSGLETRLGGYDAVYLEGAAAAGLLRRRWAGRAVVNLIDPGSRRRIRFARAATTLPRKVAELAAAAMSYLLEAMLNDPSATWVVVSESDRNYLAHTHAHAATVAIPVMLPDLPALARRDPTDTIVLTVYADLRERHMLKAFVTLADDVLRPVCTACTRVKVRVLGRIAPGPDLLDRLPELPMTFAGWSTDHLEELQQSDIVLLPDTIGTGLKNRAVQGMALGCAMVGTAVALEAIPVENGKQAYVASTPAAMIEAVLGLARDPELRHRMGGQARQFASARYGREQVMAKWMNLLQSASARR